MRSPRHRFLQPLQPRLRARRRRGAAHPRRRPGLQRRARRSRMLEQAAAQGAVVVAFPELGLSAYTCDDLFHQRALLDACEAALGRGRRGDRATLAAVAIVGLPLRVDHRLFNCAAVVGDGRVLGVVPKTYLPNYGEFYEARQFQPATPALSTEVAPAAAPTCPSAPTCSSRRRPAAAEARTSRSARTSGCRSRRRATRRWPARRCWSTCRRRTSRSASRTTGTGWSACSRRAASRPTCTRRPGSASRPPTSAWDGQALIYENGDLLAESERFVTGSHYHQRRRRPRAPVARAHAPEHVRLLGREARATRLRAFRRVRVRAARVPTQLPLALQRKVERFPYVPADPATRDERCARSTTSRSTRCCSA